MLAEPPCWRPLNFRSFSFLLNAFLCLAGVALQDVHHLLRLHVKLD